MFNFQFNLIYFINSNFFNFFILYFIFFLLLRAHFFGLYFCNYRSQQKRNSIFRTRCSLVLETKKKFKKTFFRFKKVFFSLMSFVFIHTSVQELFFYEIKIRKKLNKLVTCFAFQNFSTKTRF